MVDSGRSPERLSPAIKFKIRRRPVVAESGPYFHPILDDLNGRFREKRPFRGWPLRNQSGTAALPPEADIQLE